uniref:Non-specific protein-tyrosine kinase n=1 Tax=Lotharella oceanica TaxID=641309 RepID=A0A7S2TPI2_9EUKA|mmetsp:Transcript_22023/g.41260  ORF Transcript_22023/g.41260 Transcript_22023/m.41260 type:complete len:577 (+) Transcript_22023:142-1872(+)
MAAVENVGEMSEEELQSWLLRVRATQGIKQDVIDAIKENELTGGDLLVLSEEEIKHIAGNKIGPARRLKALIQSVTKSGEKASATEADKDAKAKPESQAVATSTAARAKMYGCDLYREEDVEVCEKLGEGNFAETFLAKLGDRKLVVKIPKQKNFAEDISEMSAFLNVTPHPNVLTLQGLLLVKDTLCFLTPLCELGSLDKLHDKLDVAKGNGFLKAAGQVASGLSHLHSLRLVHRDIACRNLLVESDGTIKIADFGLMRQVTHGSAYIRQTSKTAWPWMAPECFGRNGRFSAASDVWALGVTLWEMQTKGKDPYGWKARSYSECTAAVIDGKERLACPQGVSALENLLVQSCFHGLPSSRPVAKEIAKAAAEKDGTALEQWMEKKEYGTPVAYVDEPYDSPGSIERLEKVNSYAAQDEDEVKKKPALVREASLPNLKKQRSIFGLCIHVLVNINTKQVLFYRKLWSAYLITPMGPQGQSTSLTPDAVWDAIRKSMRSIGDGYILELGKTYSGRYAFVDRMLDKEATQFLNNLKLELARSSDGISPSESKPVGMSGAQAFFISMATDAGCLPQWLC